MKLFFVAPAGQALVPDELETLCKLAVPSPTSYSVNYGKRMTFGKGLRSLRFDELDYLEVANSSGGSLMTISRRDSTSVPQASLFQLMAFSESRDGLRTEVSLIEYMAARHDLRYGYARTLRTDFDPSTETKMRRGLLSVGVRVEGAENWMFPPSEIVRGGIKGLYPVNYWSCGVVERLAELGFDLLGEHPKLPGVVELSDAEATRLLERNPRHRSFIRFDGLGS